MGPKAGLDRLILNLNRASYHEDPSVIKKNHESYEQKTPTENYVQKSLQKKMEAE